MRASDLIEELLKETGSHLFADLRGYVRIGSHTDIAQIMLAEWYSNIHRDAKAAPEPFRFPRPWPDEITNEDVTVEQRLELERELVERSPLQEDR